MKSPDPTPTPASLLGTMRVAGMVLVLASLSALASYLVIQKGWIEPKDRGFMALSSLLTKLDDLRIAIADERNARGLPSNVAGAVGRAASETDRTWGLVKITVDSVREAGIGGVVVSSELWGGLESGIQNWRIQAQERARDQREIAYAELRRVLDTTKSELKKFDAVYTADFDALVKMRTWVLLLFSGAGGVAAWAATVFAIRRTRHSLKRISQHVEAIAKGEHAPRPLESFSEIGQVNERLNELGLTLERAQAEARNEGKAARERQRELEFAHLLALELSRGINEDEVVASFLRQVPAALGAEKGEVLRLVKAHGILEELLPRPEGGAVKGATETVVKPRVVADPAVCLGFRSRTISAAPKGCPASRWPSRPTLCMPLLSAHGPTGVVHLCAETPESIAAIPRDFAETLVRLFAPALDNARLLRESIERSTTDPLTGLANRRRLEEYSSKALALALRQGSQLSVILLDLDHFKQINDKFGHDEGDRALVAVARALQANVRESDLAARIGGDEFAILLPGSDSTAAAQVVERIREVLTVRPNARQYPIGISAGISELSPRSSTLGEMLALADRALYDAKRSRSFPSDESLTASN